MKCFNLYKMGYEQSLSESYALNHMKFSPRLFEIKLSQRCETVAYFHDCDTFVLAEGEAALSFNFHTGIHFVHHRVFYQRFSSGSWSIHDKFELGGIKSYQQAE